MAKVKTSKSLFTKAKTTLKDFFNMKDWVKLLRSIPALALTFCILASVLMNILANKSIVDQQIGNTWMWIVQDAGILFSWCGFLAGDLIVRAYGTKNAIRVSLTSVLVALFVSIVLIGVSYVPGVWGEAFLPDGSVNVAVNGALDRTIRGAWMIVLGSTLASAIGLIFNNITQGTLLKSIQRKHGDHYWGFVTASATSTALGQFLDNIVFGFVVQATLFGWGIDKVISASIIGMLLEIVVELIFTPITYKISKNWKKNGIGINTNNLVEVSIENHDTDK